jgi:two-component system, NarL family, sensor histidine kinase UhpB
MGESTVSVKQPLRVLVVEDSDDDYRLLLVTLERGGYEPSSQRVDTAEAMRDALTHREWDLIISDYMVPGFGGLPALSLLKETGLDIPFILVSGQIGEEIAVTSMKAGAHDYLMKDRLARLIPAIERELREADTRRARRRAEQERRETEERFRQLAENIEAVFFMMEPGAGNFPWRISYASPAYETVWGSPARSLYDDSSAWLQAVHPEDRSRVTAALPKIPRGEFNEEFRIVRPDERIRWIHYRIFPVRNERGEPYRFACLADDVTERKSAQEKLRNYAMQLQEAVDHLQEAQEQLRTSNQELFKARTELERRVAQRTADLTVANAELKRQMGERRRLEHELLEIADNERRRIGIDLHDDLGQHMNGIALLLEGLRLKVEKLDSNAAAEVARIQTLLLKTINLAHDLARDLASADLQGSDVVAALGGLTEQAERMFQISCRLVCDSSIPTLPQNIAAQLYKIVQEAVTNAIKHGKAKRVQITLGNEDGRLKLTVRNDGRPFPATVGQDNRMGLRIMNYRANLIGGTLEIKADGRRGAIVTCSLQIDSESNGFVSSTVGTREPLAEQRVHQ